MNNEPRPRCGGCFNMLPYCSCKRTIPDILPSFESIDPSLKVEMAATAARVEDEIDEGIGIVFQLGRLEARDLIEAAGRFRSGDPSAGWVLMQAAFQLVDMLETTLDEDEDEDPFAYA